MDTDRQFATTLARGLDVLRCFTPEKALLGNRELSEFTGLSKPTISRFTYTLTQLGYLRIDQDTKKFRLGAAVLTLSYPLLANIPLRQLVRFPMRRLAAETGGSVSLCVRDRLRIVYVETSRSSSLQAQQYSDIGMAHPIISTASGRAFLAASSPEARATLLNEIRVKTPIEWAKYSENAFRMIAEWKTLGFCYSYDEYRPDVSTVSVPYREGAQNDIFVFNCVLSSHAVKRGQLESDIGPQLLNMVMNLRKP